MEDIKQVYNGTVIWFSAQKGIGFIAWEKDGVKQTDMFMHYSDLNVEGFKTVQKDQKVNFELGLNNKGQPKAMNITLVKD